MTKFIFDLDGTITKQETLPLIAEHFGIKEEIAALTDETVKGNIPFIESFIRRVYILGKLPVNEVSDFLADTELNMKTAEFINQHKEDCIIATGSLKCWVDKLSQKIGCSCFSSECIIEDNRVKKISSILRKEKLAAVYKEAGEKVVFIGEGNNDAEAMRVSDISIASGLVHMPANSVLSIADYLVFKEEALCRLLNQLL